MIGLGANYSASLVALRQTSGVDFQAVKVASGSYLQATAGEIRSEFPDKTILHHQNSLIWAQPAEADAQVAQMLTWQREAGCPWLSAHIDTYTDQEIQRMVREGQRPPYCPPEEALKLLCGAVEKVRQRLSVPLLLENMPHWPLEEADVATTPRFITRVLASTECEFLLDTAHVRVSAVALGWDVYRYLEALPLERVVEIHVSGPGLRNGRLWDLHEPLKNVDYAILEWCLQHTRPRVVTLEYWKDATELWGQLTRLRQVLDSTDPDWPPNPGLVPAAEL